MTGGGAGTRGLTAGFGGVSAGVSFCAYFWKNSSVESGVVGFCAVAGPESVAGGGADGFGLARSSASCLRSV